MKKLLGELIDILNDKTKLLASLHLVLIKEKEAIVHSDLEVLSEAGKEKENLLLMIRFLEEQRLKIMNQLSVFYEYSFNDLTLMELCRIADEPFASRLKNSRSCLLSLMESIEEIHKLNKKLLTHSLSFVKGSLNIIHSTMPQSQVYHKTGEIQSYRHSGNVLSGEI
jgi:flagellar biosynthesis/type III secretory pathway chaperone